jgi:DNA-directed RNA polymerase specialized sigma24 family protein
MADSADESPGTAGRWELNREALDVLLAALDADRDTAARRYEGLRRKLIDFCTWRGGEMPEELADETLNRLARRLLQGEPVVKIERYALGIARLLLMEAARRREQRSIALREIRSLRPGSPEASAMSEAFERCLEALAEASRALIARYYSGDRILLAGELGLSMTALRTRALRIRKKLYECVTGRHKP